jgi:hypothetical protein
VIFMALERVAYDCSLVGDCLRRKAVDATNVDVRMVVVVPRWCKRRRGIMNRSASAHKSRQKRAAS